MHDADGEDRGMQSYDLRGLQGAHLLGVYGSLRDEQLLLWPYEQRAWWHRTWTSAFYGLVIVIGRGAQLGRVVGAVKLA